MENEVAKFCLRTDGTHTLVDISGTGPDLSSLIATAISQDPGIREIVATALIAIISHDVIRDLEKDRSEESFKEMLSKMNIGLA